MIKFFHSILQNTILNDHIFYFKKTMNRNNIIKTKSFLLTFFLTCFALLCLLKLDGNWYPFADFNHPPNQTEIGFFVSNIPVYFPYSHQSETPSEQITDYVCFDFPLDYKLSLNSYNQYVLHQLKLLKCSFIPHEQVVPVLQKKSIWHQSTDDAPPLFV